MGIRALFALRCILLQFFLLPCFLLFATPLIAGSPLCLDERQKLLASDGEQLADLGAAVAIRGDTALVGEPEFGSGGRAHVYVRNGSQWALQATLTPSDGIGGDRFGFSVALEADLAVVGAHRTDGVGPRTGAVYTFVRTGTTWTEESKLLPDEPEDGFGWAVSVAGETVVVGAAEASANSERGAAYVFTRNGGAWSLEATLVPDNPLGTSDIFGRSVAIHGEILVVGSPGRSSFRGTAYVFARSAGLWSQEAMLFGSGIEDGDLFGFGVSVSGDLIAVGAIRHDEDRGAVFLYRRTGTAWSFEEKIQPEGLDRFAEFGTSVAVQGDRALVGAPGNDRLHGLSAPFGSAFYYTRSGSAWTLQSRQMASVRQERQAFGGSVCLDGTSAMIGAPGDETAGTSAGAVYALVEGEDTNGPHIELPFSFSQFILDVAEQPYSVDVSAVDVCDPAPLVQCSPPFGTILPAGTTQVMCLATDASGNTTIRTFDFPVFATVSFDRDVNGPHPDGTVVTDQYDSLGVRVEGVSNTGNLGVEARVPGPPGSSTADMQPFGTNYIQTDPGGSGSDSGVITFHFTDLLGGPGLTSFARLYFLDIEDSGLGNGGRGHSRLELYDETDQLIETHFVPSRPNGQVSFVASSGALDLRISRAVAYVGDSLDSGGLDLLTLLPIREPQVRAYLFGTGPSLVVGKDLVLSLYTEHIGANPKEVTLKLHASLSPRRPGRELVAPHSVTLPADNSLDTPSATFSFPVPADRPRVWNCDVFLIATYEDPETGETIARSTATVRLLPPQ